MKYIPPALLAHYQQEVTTIAVCWRAVLKSGDIYGFTDASSDLLIGGVTYKARAGFVPSAVQTSSQFNVDNLDVQGVLSDESIVDTDLFAGRWDYAYVSIFRVNYMDLTMGSEAVLDGRIGQVSTGRNTFSAEIRSLFQALQQPVGRAFNASCDATFCDSRCKLNEADMTVTGVAITGFDTNRTILASSLTQSAGYFTFGKITMTSGPANGLAMEIKDYTPGHIVLQELLPIQPAIGDTMNVMRGCDKSPTTCNDTYNNKINFRGFEDIPGYDRLISGA